MDKKILAIINVDENVASKYEETNGLENLSIGGYLEREFGWIAPSGITMKNWLLISEDDGTKTWNRYINYIIEWAFDNQHNRNEDSSPASYYKWLNGNKISNNKVYTWKDIISINGVCYAEEFPISGITDGDGDYYQLDDFYEAVAKKYGVDVDDIETYMMDNIEFEPQVLPWGAEACGCYIDGVAEWLIGLDEESD